MEAISNQIDRIRRHQQQSQEQQSPSAMQPLLPIAATGLSATVPREGRGMRNLLQGMLTSGRMRNLLSTHGLERPLLRRYSDLETSTLAAALEILTPVVPQSPHAMAQHIINASTNGTASQFGAVMTLIKYQIIDPDRVGPEQISLLGHLCAHGALAPDNQFVPLADRVVMLVTQGANPDQPNHRGQLPLELAWSRQTEQAYVAGQALLTAEFNPLVRYRNGRTILHRAAAQGNLPLLNAWCRAGLPVNLRDERGQTPLMDAAEQNRPEGMRVLLDQHGIDVDATDREGMTALHLATASGNVAGAEMLLQNGVDPRDPGGRNASPYKIAEMLAMKYQEPQMLQLMQRYQ